MAEAAKPTIVVDTREQTPWVFDDTKVDTVRGTLKTGDYSLLGMESTVCIERKSLDDLVNTLIHDRERFERELQRMQAFAFRCVIVEGSLSDVRDHKYHSQAHPSSVFGLACCLDVDYGVPFRWCSSRAIAARCCERLLRRVYERSLDAATNLSPST